MSAEKKYNVIFVLGGPGAGKGTQCSKIVERYGYVHLSAGDLLRAERNDPASKYGAEIEGHIKNGSIVPVAITCSLLEQAMKKNSTESSKWNFLIDGFPRNEDNNQGWQKEMTDKTTLQMVLVFNCGEDMCVERCIKRGETSGRSDDNRESLKKRIETYQKSTMPIIKYYRDQNLVKEINAEKSTDEVFEQVKEAMESLKS